ncbi:nucleoside 2-deoxyribosyltransferase [Niallia sp. JL1B1071]|uniref:nucleoside 2-deoxyribosyltransferase n=1 Tax=Niallia tiangongensis TaxID=3237105 RepID=UPI0037DC9F79
MEAKEYFIVVNGGISKCKKRVTNKGIEYFKESSQVKQFVAYEEDIHHSFMQDFIFENKEDAQKSILNNTISPTALKWKEDLDQSILKIYLAGFHVFHPESLTIRTRMINLCEKYGYRGLYPSDNEPIDNLQREEQATMIFYSNEGLIRECDVIVANLNPFRGNEPDSGTVFECGLGYGLGKKLYGYIDNGQSMKERLSADVDKKTGLYKEGMFIEDFNLPLNLMLSIPMTIVVGTLEDCLEKMAEDTAI